jgi:asparagine synthetase B (glutamine-hydrolysing)
VCGIAGILSLAPDKQVAPAALATMAAQLVHRGPDDDGQYLDPQGRCGFAFRRLAIIDLAGGHQPITNEAGTVQVMLNGEFYNFRALRAELEAQGHRFATRADSEVIAHLYEQVGERASTDSPACSRLPFGMRPGGGCCWPATASARNH